MVSLTRDTHDADDAHVGGGYCAGLEAACCGKCPTSGQDVTTLASNWSITNIISFLFADEPS